MRSEDQCPAEERYLFADALFPDQAIAHVQQHCIRRCAGKPKDEAYERFVAWKRQENEVAVFTLYAYADFMVPKTFDIVFQTGNPNNYIETGYELTQSVYEGWLPCHAVDHGHKHLAVFRFREPVPSIFNVLPLGDNDPALHAKPGAYLGFCSSQDFGAIQARLERVAELRRKHGQKWYEFDH